MHTRFTRPFGRQACRALIYSLRLIPRCPQLVLPPPPLHGSKCAVEGGGGVHTTVWDPETELGPAQEQMANWLWARCPGCRPSTLTVYLVGF